MDVPDFADFLNSIDAEKLQNEIAISIGQRLICTKSTEKRDMEALLSEIMYQSIDASTKVFLAYLQKYHEWLKEQI